MININKLKGLMEEKQKKVKYFAPKLGIAESTLYGKLNRGILNNLEIELFINELEIENPNEIFFSKEVSLK